MKEWKKTTRHGEEARRSHLLLWKRYDSVEWNYFDHFYGLIVSMNASRLLRKLRNLAMTDGEEPDNLLSALGFPLERAFIGKLYQNRTPAISKPYSLRINNNNKQLIINIIQNGMLIYWIRLYEMTEDNNMDPSWQKSMVKIKKHA